MKQLIYADNAATTKLDKKAFETMLPWLQAEYGNASQPYSFSRAPKHAIAEARSIIASCINASPEEIYFTSGGTESDNWAIKGASIINQRRKLTITSQIEHHAVLNSCKSIERLGYPVVYLPPDSKGIISPEAVEPIIDSKVHLLSIMFANNEIGTIEPIKQLAKIASEKGVLFHTDAVQAVGHVKIDVNDLGVDMLSASAHKFNGPKGVGFLYVRRGTEIAPLLDGGGQEKGFRAGTENTAGIVGMATALQTNCQLMQEIQNRLSTLETIILNSINQLDYIRNGHSCHIPGNISLSFSNIDGESLLHLLDLKGISISTGSACDSVNNQVSHVIRALGVHEKYAKGTIRISLGRENTEEDAKAIGKALVQVVGTIQNRQE